MIFLSEELILEPERSISIIIRTKGETDHITDKLGSNGLIRDISFNNEKFIHYKNVSIELLEVLHNVIKNDINVMSVMVTFD